MVAIIAAGSRSVIEAVFGSDKVGDRNFATYKFFAAITGTGAGFLIRGKTGHGAMKLPATTILRDGSYLATIAGGVPVRVVQAQITIGTPASTRTNDYRLITTLLDPGVARLNSWWICTIAAGKSRLPTAS